MINREKVGIVDSGDWPTFSVPEPVEAYMWKLARRLPPEVKVDQVGGRGYHIVGWSYIEVQVIAPSWGRAYEEAQRLEGTIMMEFQLMGVGE